MVEPATTRQVEQQLDLVLRHEQAWGRPAQAYLFVLDETAGDVLGVAEIDGGACGTGGTEGDAGKLQAGRGGPRTLLDEIQREGLHGGVVLVLQHFQAIDNGADGIDHVMTYARAKQGGKIERIELKTGGHRST